MGTSRVPAKAGWSSPSRLPKGRSGKPLCRQCGLEVPTSRNTFCSPECVHEWRLTTDPTYQRRHVHERDRGVCSACGLDCDALERDYQAAKRALYRERCQPDGDLPHRTSLLWQYGHWSRDAEALLRGLGFIPGRSFWEMDHVVPVVEGGGGCGLDGLRTLCCPCHRRETAALARRRAGSRRAGG